MEVRALERRIAKWFGGTRRGADYGDRRGGKTDIIAPGWAVEVKLLARPRFQQLLDACWQAERNARELEMPVAVIKRKNDRDINALVVMRLETFADWHLKTRSDDPGDGFDEDNFPEGPGGAS